MPDRKKLYYLRVSQEDAEVASQAEPESLSIAAQRLCIRQYIAAHPELGDVEAFEELVDDGYSGTNFERPGAARLLQLVQSGGVETVIVRDLSRFARNYLEAGHYLEFVFPAYDVRFLSVNDHFDTGELGESTAGYRLAVRNLINQLYSRDISRKIKSAVDLKKLRGEYVYGAVPYGYRKGLRRNTIEVDGPAAEIVRQIFSWASEGVTVTQIASRLNEAKVQTPSAYSQNKRGRYPVRPYWSFDSVKNILTNRIYTGDTVPFRSHVVSVGSKRVKRIPEAEQLVLPDTHEAIVSREAYYRARQTIRSRKKSAPKESGSLLAPYVVCGCCGNKLYKGRARNRTFRCPTARYAPEAGCTEVSIQEAKLEELLLRALRSQCAVADAKVQTVRTAQKDALCRQTSIRRELQREKQKLEQNRRQQVCHYEAYARGELDKAEFLRRKAETKRLEDAAAAQAALLTQQLRQLAAESGSAAAVLESAGPLRAHAGLQELTPALLRELLRRVTVYPGGAIQITWNFQDIFQDVE